MRKLALAFMGAALVGLVAGSAFAKPPGVRDTDVGKQLWKFNVISLPENSGWDDNGNACKGARIFFQEGAGATLGVITWVLSWAANTDFTITDCDGTDGAGSVLVDDQITGNFIVAIRVLGPNTSLLNFVCAEFYNDVLHPDEDLCVIDNGVFGKNKQFTRVMENISDEAYEEVLWTLSGDWKIFDVRVFEYFP